MSSKNRNYSILKGLEVEKVIIDSVADKLLKVAKVERRSTNTEEEFDQLRERVMG